VRTTSVPVPPDQAFPTSRDLVHNVNKIYVRLFVCLAFGSLFFSDFLSGLAKNLPFVLAFWQPSGFCDIFFGRLTLAKPKLTAWKMLDCVSLDLPTINTFYFITNKRILSQIYELI